MTNNFKKINIIKLKRDGNHHILIQNANGYSTNQFIYISIKDKRY